MKMKNFIAEDAFFQGYFTEVCLDNSKGNQLSYFQNGNFFQNSLVIHEAHDWVKCRWKNKLVFSTFHSWKIDNTFVTFVSNKSLDDQVHLRKKIYHTVLFQGCHCQFLGSIKQLGLDICKKSLLNDKYYLFFKF